MYCFIAILFNEQIVVILRICITINLEYINCVFPFFSCFLANPMYFVVLKSRISLYTFIMILYEQSRIITRHA